MTTPDVMVAVPLVSGMLNIQHTEAAEKEDPKEPSEDQHASLLPESSIGIVRYVPLHENGQDKE
jgi:hypothetical protein